MDKQQREAQREAVKTLAIAVGVRESARQTGINENTILSWSKRDNWFKDTIVPKPNTITNPNNGTAINAIKPSVALANLLEEDNRETKLSLSRGIRRIAKHIENEKEDRLFEKADRVKNVVSSASQLHNWEAKEEGSGVLPGLKVYSQQTVIQVKQSAPAQPTDSDPSA